MKKAFTLVEMMIAISIIGIAFAVILPVVAERIQLAERPTTAPPMASVHFPAPTGWVVDEAAKLSDSTRQDLALKAEAISRNNGPEIAVVTVHDMGGESVEQYSMHLAEKWKVGKRSSDNGVILLVAMAERKIRIEVGTGLEPKLTDSQAKRIIDEAITPSLKQGDFDGGIKLGFERIAQAIR